MYLELMFLLLKVLSLILQKIPQLQTKFLVFLIIITRVILIKNVYLLYFEPSISTSQAYSYFELIGTQCQVIAYYLPKIVRANLQPTLKPISWHNTIIRLYYNW